MGQCLLFRPSVMGCIWGVFCLILTSSIKEVFLKENILVHLPVTRLGLKGESIENFKQIITKSGLTLDVFSHGERAGFSHFPSCLLFKRTIFLCLKASAVENSQVSRPIYKCTHCRMPPLGCHLFEAFTERAVPDMIEHLA